ncbi:hypothetical protein ID866_7006 [Astraeus odoratus]|nr:hypothetical protein ID866_7006 [Astraeus odoratus]
MSDPYVYTPSTFQPTPHLNYSPYAPRSPFIPSQLPPASPYLGPTNPSPQPYGGPFEDTYYPPRPRRPSWHSGMASSPFLPTPDLPSHSKRRSFGAQLGDASNVSPWAYPYQGVTRHFEIHPLLNGELPNGTLYLNLALPSFYPMRIVGPGQYAVIPPEELQQPATNPPTTRMRITHDAIPHWPIDLELQSNDYQTASMPPPITLGDVLYMIHSSLHRQISHHDWARLRDFEQEAIARAYARRCRSTPSVADLEASQGVKRVDYLTDRPIFRGLLRSHDGDGFFHCKMIT